MWNILKYLEQHYEKQTAQIFIDAEKAFDHLN